MSWKFNPFTNNLDYSDDQTLVRYFGKKNTDGSWRIIIRNNDLSVQRRESGVWVEKSVFLP